MPKRILNVEDQPQPPQHTYTQWFLFAYLFLATLGLCCCTGFPLAAVSGFLSCGIFACCRAWTPGPTGFIQ